eukprot:GHRQ01008131.1.p1 GENE.GHRQ01008131.1~~GHRQ01008131.1.p1  ORF type:complete len:244 (+),score=72.44 GHRQ01008131.1:727-1458(+)
MASSISLGQFVHQPSQQLSINALPHMQLQTPRCLLFGPQRSGKTSLLFQYAFQLACSGQEVVFICDRAQLEQSPLLLPVGVSHQHAAFSKIHFKYVQDLHQLRTYGACIHLLQEPPAAVIVDDLAHLLANARLPDKRARDTEVTRALAYLADGLDQLREQRGLSVFLLVSDTCCDEGPHNLYLLQRWFPLMLQVTGPAPHVAARVLTLSVAQACKHTVTPAAARAAVNYTITQSYLNLEHVQL